MPRTALALSAWLALWVTVMAAANPAGAMAAPVVSPTDAKAHIGETVTVEGIVSNVLTSRSQTTFIDMGGRFPNNSFAGVIFSDAAPRFPTVHGLTGHLVDITGRIRLYRGRPEIILEDPSQLVAK